MKHLKRWLLLLFTLLLVIAGAAMPWAAARLQDRQGVAAGEVLPLDSVSLTLRKESELGSVLRLLRNVYDEMEWPGITQMTEEEACQAAFDALTALDQAGLIESGYMGYTYGTVEAGILEDLKASWGCGATPVLALAEDGSSAIIWFCYWKGKNAPNYELLVDDATGLAVSGNIPSPPADREGLYMRMERWLIFFQDYYGIEIQDIQEDILDYSPAGFTYFFDPEDGLGLCGLIVYMYTFEMDFGACPPELLAGRVDLELVPPAVPPAAATDKGPFNQSSSSTFEYHISIG